MKLQQHMRRTLVAAALTAAALLCFGSCSPAESDTAPAPSLFPAATPRSTGARIEPRPGASILLIVVDTLRRDHLGTYGYSRATSPHIDALASEGIRYDGAISPSPWTTPTMASLLTSQYPTSLGIKEVRSKLSEDVVFLSEVLRDGGYSTGAVVSNTFCTSAWNFDQGFDSFDDSMTRGFTGVSSPEVTDAAIAFLDRQEDRPFFLWAHYYDPHNRYIPHDAFPFRSAPDYDGPVTPDLSFKALRKMTDSLTAADLQRVRDFYDSEIAFTDHHVGRLLDHLRRTGMDDRTLVIFTSDHGEEFRDHGLIGHSHSLYQELVHVPLIMRYPGAAPGVHAGAVGLVDLFPTVLDFVGIPSDAPVVGTSLLQRLEDGGAGSDQRVYFTETNRKRILRAAVTRRYKLVHDLESEAVEFYDLRSDPGEQLDLAPDPPPEFRRMTAALEAWREEVDAGAREGKTLRLTPEMRERLRTLGYVGD